MSPGKCCRHGDSKKRACSCAMGNLYRFTEPIILVSLARLGTAHGYQILQESNKMAVTHAGLDVGAIYRTLHTFEEKGLVQSEWDTDGSGPAKRVYVLTADGYTHLRQWTEVLEDFMTALGKVLVYCREAVVKE